MRFRFPYPGRARRVGGLHVLLLVIVLLAAGMAGCERAPFSYNICNCAPGIGNLSVLRFQTAGEEEKLEAFVRAIRAELGEPHVTFLNYTIEEPEEFFHPERRAIDPNILSSPFGIQKIMVWKRVWRPEWHADSVEVSLQIEEKRKGSRPVDQRYCVLELRVRTVEGRDLLADCAAARPVRVLLGDLIRLYVGNPQRARKSMAQLHQEANFRRKQAKYADRVAGVLDGGCYPPVAHHRGTTVFRIQLCESDSLRDTLRAKMMVTDAAGDPIPHYLYDMMKDTISDRIMIYDGYLGYTLYTKELEEIQEIRLIFDSGREMLLYEKGDFVRDHLPFRTRFDPEYFRRRQLEQAKPPADIYSRLRREIRSRKSPVRRG